MRLWAFRCTTSVIVNLQLNISCQFQNANLLPLKPLHYHMHQSPRTPLRHMLHLKQRRICRQEAQSRHCEVGGTKENNFHLFR